MWTDAEIEEAEADWVRCNDCDEVVHTTEAREGRCAVCAEERSKRPRLTIAEWVKAGCP